MALNLEVKVEQAVKSLERIDSKFNAMSKEVKRLTGQITILNNAITGMGSAFARVTSSVGMHTSGITNQVAIQKKATTAIHSVTGALKTQNEVIVKGSSGLVKFTMAITSLSASYLVFTQVTQMVGRIFSIGMDYQKTMNIVKMVTGATKKEFKELEYAARKAGSTTVWGATAAAEALKAMSLAGLDAKQAIAALPGVLKLALMGEVGIEKAADVTVNTMLALKMSIEDLPRVFNTFALVAMKTTSDVQMMSQSMKFAAPIAGQLGYSVEQVSAMIGVLAQSGLKAGIAGRGLQVMFQRTAKAASFLAMTGKQDLISVLEELERRNVSITQMTEIFGLQALKSALVLKSSVKEYKELLGSLAEGQDVLNEKAKQMERTVKGSISRLRSFIDEIVISIFRAHEAEFSRAINDLRFFLAKNKEEIVEFFNDLIETTKRFYGIMSTIIKPLVQMFGMLSGSISDLGVTNKTLGLALGAYGTALGAGAALKYARPAIETALPGLLKVSFAKTSFIGLGVLIADAFIGKLNKAITGQEIRPLQFTFNGLDKLNNLLVDTINNLIAMAQGKEEWGGAMTPKQERWKQGVAAGKYLIHKTKDGDTVVLDLTGKDKYAVQAEEWFNKNKEYIKDLEKELKFTVTPSARKARQDQIDAFTTNLNKALYETVRMLGIDTLESVHLKKERNTPLGFIASEYAKARLAEGAEVTFMPTTKKQKRDLYGRLLGDIYLDGKLFSEELIKDVMATVYETFPHPNTMIAKRLEAAAKAARTSQGIPGKGSENLKKMMAQTAQILMPGLPWDLSQPELEKMSPKTFGLDKFYEEVAPKAVKYPFAEGKENMWEVMIAASKEYVRILGIGKIAEIDLTEETAKIAEKWRLARVEADYATKVPKVSKDIFDREMKSFKVRQEQWAQMKDAMKEYYISQNIDTETASEIVEKAAEAHLAEELAIFDAIFEGNKKYSTDRVQIEKDWWSYKDKLRDKDFEKETQYWNDVSFVGKDAVDNILMYELSADEQKLVQLHRIRDAHIAAGKNITEIDRRDALEREKIAIASAAKLVDPYFEIAQAYSIEGDTSKTQEYLDRMVEAFKKSQEAVEMELIKLKVEPQAVYALMNKNLEDFVTKQKETWDSWSGLSAKAIADANKSSKKIGPLFELAQIAYSGGKEGTSQMLLDKMVQSFMEAQILAAAELRKLGFEHGDVLALMNKQLEDFIATQQSNWNEWSGLSAKAMQEVAVANKMIDPYFALAQNAAKKGNMKKAQDYLNSMVNTFIRTQEQSAAELRKLELSHDEILSLIQGQLNDFVDKYQGTWDSFMEGISGSAKDLSEEMKNLLKEQQALGYSQLWGTTGLKMTITKQWYQLKPGDFGYGSPQWIKAYTEAELQRNAVLVAETAAREETERQSIQATADARVKAYDEALAEQTRLHDEWLREMERRQQAAEGFQGTLAGFARQMQTQDWGYTEWTSDYSRLLQEIRGLDPAQESYFNDSLEKYEQIFEVLQEIYSIEQEALQVYKSSAGSIYDFLLEIQGSNLAPVQSVENLTGLFNTYLQSAITDPATTGAFLSFLQGSFLPFIQAYFGSEGSGEYKDYYKLVIDAVETLGGVQMIMGNMLDMNIQEALGINKEELLSDLTTIGGLIAGIGSVSSASATGVGAFSGEVTDSGKAAVNSQSFIDVWNQYMANTGTYFDASMTNMTNMAQTAATRFAEISTDFNTLVANMLAAIAGAGGGGTYTGGGGEPPPIVEPAPAPISYDYHWRSMWDELQWGQTIPQEWWTKFIAHGGISVGDNSQNWTMPGYWWADIQGSPKYWGIAWSPTGPNVPSQPSPYIHYPGNALGGLTSGLSFAGEIGPEWVVPTYEPQRSNFLRDVGVDSAEIGAAIAKKLSELTGSSGGGSGKQVRVTLSVDGRALGDVVMENLKTDGDFIDTVRTISRTRH